MLKRSLIIRLKHKCCAALKLHHKQLVRTLWKFLIGQHLQNYVEIIIMRMSELDLLPSDDNNNIVLDQLLLAI